MRFTYLCPRCHAHLNAREETIALLAERGEHRGLVMFSSEPGNYEFFSARGLDVVEGDVWTFRCPVCDHDLTESDKPKLARITLDTQKGEHAVYFSRTAGEHATFVVDAEGVVEAHGEHRSIYEQVVWFSIDH
ncbi:MAG: hypothetical protein JRJ84_25455 [Deltaproteobacteria bacterium]|nr:hypothetical protein [Deltaproteobacteria bacterium]